MKSNPKNIEEISEELIKEAKQAMLECQPIEWYLKYHYPKIKSSYKSLLEELGREIEGMKMKITKGTCKFCDNKFCGEEYHCFGKSYTRQALSDIQQLIKKKI